MRAVAIAAVCVAMAAAVALARPHTDARHPHGLGHGHSHGYGLAAGPYPVAQGQDFVEFIRALVPQSVWDEANAPAGGRAYPKLWLRKFGAAVLRAIPQKYHALAAARRAEREHTPPPPQPQPQPPTQQPESAHAPGYTPPEPLPGPYWTFLPWFTGAAIPAGDAAQWQAPCFAQSSLRAVQTGSGSDGSATYELQFGASGMANSTCSDHYLIGTIEHVVFHHADASNAGNSSMTWSLPAGTSASTKLDVDRNGFRVFRFQYALDTLVLDVIDTLYLFVCPQNGGHVPAECEAANADFVRRYSFVDMEKRDVSFIAFNETTKSQVQSGDMFGVLRLDGLDPVISWVFGGGGTGHMTVAMWLDGVLHVCESTVVDSYWPTEGLQCHEWDQWMALAQKAMHNAVFLPLSPQMRALFNESAAVAWMQQRVGVLDYGYRNMLWGWIDSATDDNYPFPWLTQQLHQLLPCIAARLVPSFAAMMWTDAFNQRLGTDISTPLADVYAQMYERGMEFGDLVALPEQDDWQYRQVSPTTNQTIVGQQMVCNVFVCEIWKAAGLFAAIGSDIQCTESTDLDIYTSQLFDNAWPHWPAACVADMGSSPYCQLVGDYRIQLRDYNSRPVVQNGWTQCPRGLPPDFVKPTGC